MRKLSTHAMWIESRIERCLERIDDPATAVKCYEGVLHAMVDAKPSELREALEHLDLKECDAIKELVAFAWRVVGNEYRDDPVVVEKACKSILRLSGNWLNTTEAFAPKDNWLKRKQ